MIEADSAPTGNGMAGFTAFRRLNVVSRFTDGVFIIMTAGACSHDRRMVYFTYIRESINIMTELTFIICLDVIKRLRCG
jgi:hypothetical protein